MSDSKWHPDYPKCLRLALQVHFVPMSRRPEWANGVIEALESVFDNAVKRVMPERELNFTIQATALLVSCLEGLPPTKLDATRKTGQFRRFHQNLVKFAGHANIAGKMSGFQRCVPFLQLPPLADGASKPPLRRCRTFA